VKRLLLILLVFSLLLSIFILSSCKPKEVAKEGVQKEGTETTAAVEKVEKKEKAELRYMMWDPQIIEKEQAVADNFMAENPHIKITIETAAWTQFWEKMQAMAAGKNLPDVFWMSSDYVKPYSKMGALLDIDDRVANLDQSKYFPSAFNVLRAPNFAGKMYAFPWAVVACISYYNIRLFDEAGLAYPTDNWTWEDMRKLAIKLTRDTDGDGTADQWGYSIWGRYTHLYPYVFNNDEHITDDDFTTLTVTSPKGREAMKFLVDLIVKDKAAATPAQTKGISKPFSTGKFAMTTEGSWRIDTYRKGLEDPFGIVQVPLGPKSGGKRNVYGWADAYSISAFTKHDDAAWEYMMYLSGPGRPIDSILGGKVPIWKAAALSDTWLEADKLPANKKLVLEALDLIGPKVTMPPGYEEWNAMIQSDFEKIVLGEGDFDQVMDELQVKVDKVLARSR